MTDWTTCNQPGCRSRTLPEIAARVWPEGRCELHGPDGQEIREAAHRGSQVARLLAARAVTILDGKLRFAYSATGYTRSEE